MTKIQELKKVFLFQVGTSDNYILTKRGALLQEKFPLHEIKFFSLKYLSNHKEKNSSIRAGRRRCLGEASQLPSFSLFPQWDVL